MDTTQTALPVPQPPAARAPRRLPAGQGAALWGEAWRIFCAAPLTWIAILVAYVAISIVLAIIPVIGAVAHVVLTPVFVGGVMLGCHALARGEPLDFAHLFAGFKENRFPSLALLGLILLALTIVFGIVMLACLFVTIGISGLTALAGQGDPWAIAGAVGVGFVIVLFIALVGATLIAMAYWMAPALVVLDGMEPVAALKKSFDACLTNMGAFLVYGVIYVGLAIAASIPLGLGWLVLAPMVVASCYASWRQIFGA